MFDDKKVNFRRYQGTVDLSLMISVRTQCVSKDEIDLSSTLESIPTVKQLHDLLIDDHCDPANDVLIVEYENIVVGYARVCWWLENDGTALFLHNEYLVPKFRTIALWQRILDWAERRIKNISLYVKSDNKMLGANASSTEKEKTSILLNNGYKKVFSLAEMSFDNYDRSTEPVKLPDGFSLKEVKQEHLRMIWEANNSIYEQRNFIPQQTESDFNNFSNRLSYDFALCKVAYFSNELAGFVIGSTKNNRGEIDEVSILPKYRRKGLARSLLILLLHEFRNKGIQKIYLHTNGENVSGALSLYQNIGFVHYKDFVKYRKTLE